MGLRPTKSAITGDSPIKDSCVYIKVIVVLCQGMILLLNVLKRVSIQIFILQDV